MTQSGNAANIMNRGISRSIFRWIHLVFSIPILGYIYSPFEKLPNYAPATRFVIVPAMSFRDCGWGKAMSFDDLFRKDRARVVQVRTGTSDLRSADDAAASGACHVVDLIGVAGRRVAGQAERS